MVGDVPESPLVGTSPHQWHYLVSDTERSSQCQVPPDMSVPSVVVVVVLLMVRGMSMSTDMPSSHHDEGRDDVLRHHPTALGCDTSRRIMVR